MLLLVRPTHEAYLKPTTGKCASEVASNDLVKALRTPMVHSSMTLVDRRLSPLRRKSPLARQNVEPTPLDHWPRDVHIDAELQRGATECFVDVGDLCSRDAGVPCALCQTSPCVE